MRFDYTSTNSLLSTAAPTLNAWNHVAATVSQGRFASLYLNGNLVGSYQYASEASELTAAITLGRWTTSSPYTFAGREDEIKFFGRTLSADEVLELYAMPAPVAPTLTAFKINDGNAQRSMVNTLTVQFDQPVTLDDGAISLALRGGAATTPTITTADNLTFTLSFSAAAAIGGSLPDGIYDLTVNAAKVHNSLMPSLTMVGGNQTFTFHRLYGDYNGNKTVNSVDYTGFQTAFNQSTGSSAIPLVLRLQQQRRINSYDYAQFKNRLGITYSY